VVSSEQGERSGASSPLSSHKEDSGELDVDQLDTCAARPGSANRRGKTAESRRASMLRASSIQPASLHIPSSIDGHNSVEHVHERRQRSEQPMLKDLFAPEYVWEPVEASSCTGFDVRTHFGFCSLFMGKKDSDVRLTLKIPDMVLLSDGMPAHWLFTANANGPNAGKVLSKSGSQLVPSKIKAHFTAVATRNQNNFEGHVAMLHEGQSAPTILAYKAFDNLILAMHHERQLGNKILQSSIDDCQRDIPDTSNARSW